MERCVTCLFLIDLLGTRSVIEKIKRNSRRRLEKADIQVAQCDVHHVTWPTSGKIT